MIPRIKNNPRWGFVSGRISVLEGRLQPREFFLNLIAQEHLEDLVPHMQDTFLRDHISPGTVWADFSDLCDRFFYEMTLSIKEECPSSIPADLFLLGGDYLNLKSALTGSSEFPFHFGLLTQEKLLTVSHGDYADIPPALRESEAGFAGEAGEIDPAILDIILDGAYLRNLLAMADDLGSELVTAYIHDRVLSYIVIILWRALRQQQSLRHYQQYLLPLGDFNHVVTELSGMSNVDNWPPVVGGVVGDILFESLELLSESEQIPGFELRVANYLTRIARDGKIQTAGPERVFAFLAGVQVEVQNLKLVMNGRLNRIDQTLLRQRLRECYV
ncbi:MAG: V-type ATPase subunit [Deltaproteobacteria bacterium]|nr:V-type ATPase subunit [Deltaproteobacteria bacterium]